MSAAIRVEGLRKRFGETPALDGVDLTVAPGQVLGVLGPNGAGKTTMVRILATLLPADGGTAMVAGFDVARDAHRVRESIGLTGQYASIDGKLTGRENLLLVARLLGLSRAMARQRADQLLRDFGLTEAAHRAAKHYSGGMRRRLDLAASLVGEPAILFLDEPTTGLDPRARLDLWSLVRQRVANGTTVLLTTQYLEEADHLADEIVVFDHGRVIASGTSDALKARIGARTLVLTAEREADVVAMGGIITAIVGAEPSRNGRSLSVAVGNGRIAPVVIRELDAAGIAVEDLTLRSPSLDDVFLTLTGRDAEAVPSPSEANSDDA